MYQTGEFMAKNALLFMCGLCNVSQVTGGFRGSGNSELRPQALVYVKMF
jgi:hypothetical protein